MPSIVSEHIQHKINPLIRKINELFNKEMVEKYDFLLAQLDVVLEERVGKRFTFTESQRRNLVKHGLPVKKHLAELCKILKPETLLKWNRDQKKKKWDYSKRIKNRTGRSGISHDTESLIIQMSEENRWGHNRIVGELKKLGHQICDTTVGNILKRNGLPFSPDKKGMSWKDFIKSHMQVTWACDFFTEEVWTMGGLITFYCLFFIHLSTRKVYIAGCTPTPHSQWVAQQARNFSMHVTHSKEECKYLIHDRDSSFIAMDNVLKSEIKIIKTPPHAPNCNAFTERFVREARETLNQMIFLGERSFMRTLKIIEKHHNQHRPHQGIDNTIPDGFDYPHEPVVLYPELDRRAEDVVCHPELGGLLNHYSADKAA